jgi:hypothetical protein
MPDIELFGKIDAQAMIDVLSSAPYGGAITIIEHTATVYSMCAPDDDEGKAEPFIRVAATHQFKHMADLIARLRRLKIDLEIVKIETFYPKGELR